MRSDRASRLSYEDSCRLLQSLGYPDVGADGVIPPIPDRRPQCDDEAPHGVSFFRTFVGQDIEEGDADVRHRNLENLTLPRTFFGRSYIHHVSFKNTNLSESSLCWNDFSEVNFTDGNRRAKRTHLKGQNRRPKWTHPSRFCSTGDFAS